MCVCLVARLSFAVMCEMGLNCIDGSNVMMMRLHQDISCDSFRGSARLAVGRRPKKSNPETKLHWLCSRESQSTSSRKYATSQRIELDLA